MIGWWLAGLAARGAGGAFSLGGRGPHDNDIDALGGLVLFALLLLVLLALALALVLGGPVVVAKRMVIRTTMQGGGE